MLKKWRRWNGPACWNAGKEGGEGINVKKIADVKYFTLASPKSLALTQGFAACV
jgi:hypothetical protein